jgi:hypothetical protein
MALAVIDVEDMEFKAGEVLEVSFVRSQDGKVWSASTGDWQDAPNDARHRLIKARAPHLAGVWLGLVDVPISEGVVAVYWHPRLGNVGFYGAEPKSPTRYVSIAFPVS